LIMIKAKININTLNDSKGIPSAGIARLVIAHQVINCIKCPVLSRCGFTKSLSIMAMEGYLDPDAIEFMNSCASVSVRDLLNIMNKQDSKDFVNKLLSISITRRKINNALRIWAYKEGSAISIGDLSIVVDNTALPNNEVNLALSFDVNVDGNNCSVTLNKIKNEYLNHLTNLVSKVVPNNDYSLSSLLESRNKFLGMFLKDENLRSAIILAGFGLGDLTPLILNQDIEDIFITQDSVYINHSEYGICKVINTNPQLIAKQLLKLANISGIRISTDNPSGKFSININGKRLRITIDRWPLVEGVSVHIRLHKKPFTVSDLVRIGTIDPIDASKLILALRSGYNILIMGPPSSGKTTLLNALDMTLPLNLRRIYIDETDESLELPAPSVKVRAIIGKTEEVLKSLHRGYGVLIIGELREREHFEALIHGVNAGLQVLGTTHADSVEALMGRLRVFSLSDVVNYNRFIMVIMRKVDAVRRVKEIIYPPGFEPGKGQLDRISDIIMKLRYDDYVSFASQLSNILSKLGD